MNSEFKGEGRHTKRKKTTKNQNMIYFLLRAKTPGILQRAEMTLNILEDDVLGIFSKNPLRTWKSKRASTTMIIGPLTIIRAIMEEKVRIHKQIGLDRRKQLAEYQDL